MYGTPKEVDLILAWKRSWHQILFFSHTKKTLRFLIKESRDYEALLLHFRSSLTSIDITMKQVYYYYYKMKRTQHTHTYYTWHLIGWWWYRWNAVTFFLMFRLMSVMDSIFIFIRLSLIRRQEISKYELTELFIWCICHHHHRSHPRIIFPQKIVISMFLDLAKRLCSLFMSWTEDKEERF